MSIIIRIYILLCIALLFFDICFLFIQNQRTLVAYRTNRTLEKKVREEIAVHRESGAFAAEFTDSLSRELSKTKNLLTLQGVIENDAEAREWFRPYVFASWSNMHPRTILSRPIIHMFSPPLIIVGKSRPWSF